MACECHGTTVGLSSDETHTRCHLTPKSFGVSEAAAVRWRQRSFFLDQQQSFLAELSPQPLLNSFNWSDHDITPHLTCCSTWWWMYQSQIVSEAKVQKSCKSNRVICSRAACTGQRFLLSPWKYNSLKVAICSCTRICCHFSACALIFSMCPSVCMRLNKKLVPLKAPLWFLDSGFQAGDLCWI